MRTEAGFREGRGFFFLKIGNLSMFDTTEVREKIQVVSAIQKIHKSLVEYFTDGNRMECTVRVQRQVNCPLVIEDEGSPN